MAIDVISVCQPHGLVICEYCRSVALDISQDQDHLRVGGEGDEERPVSPQSGRFRRKAGQVSNALTGNT